MPGDLFRFLTDSPWRADLGKRLLHHHKLPLYQPLHWGIAVTGATPVCGYGTCLRGVLLSWATHQVTLRCCAPMGPTVALLMASHAPLSVLTHILVVLGPRVCCRVHGFFSYVLWNLCPFIWERTFLAVVDQNLYSPNCAELSQITALGVYRWWLGGLEFKASHMQDQTSEFYYYLRVGDTEHT